MKKYIILILLITGYVNAQVWKWNHPVPQGNTLKRVSFYNPWFGYAVGENGTLIASFNQGNSWEVQPEGITDNIQDVFCVDSLNVWAVGDNALLLHTTDGGNFWSTPQLQGEFNGLNAIYFTGNGSTGWLAGDSKTLYKTINSGANWTKIDILPSLQVSGINSLYFLNANEGWMVGSNMNGSAGIILHTTNGGVNWTTQKTTTETSLRIKFYNSNLGLAVGSAGAIYRTTDSGANWTKIASSTTNGLNDLLISSQSNITIVGDNGTIISSTDGGLTWVSESLSTWVSINSISSFNGTKAAVGENGFIAFKTGSGAWDIRQTGNSNSVNWITFNSSGNGMSAGQNGEILFSNDGGKTWVTNTHTITNSVSFYGASYVGTNCWAVGDQGYIEYSGDAGSSWQKQNTGTTSTLLSISFVNSSSGWVTGDGGLILHTTNGGSNWFTQSSSTTNTIFAVFFYDANNGWYCADGGIIGHTTDGGMHWSLQTSGVSVTLFGIHFLNATTGFATGTGGVILKTTNGGASWQQITSGVTVNLYLISGVAGSLWGIGDAGTLLNSTDSGATWQLKYPITQMDFFGLYAPDDKSAWICGDYGTIISFGNSVNSVTQDPLILPSSFILHQNYPNPFNPSTRITFSISKTARVKLFVFDLLGREVAELKNEEMVPGNYTVQFDGSRLTSGIYILRMAADGYSTAQKMVLLK